MSRQIYEILGDRICRPKEFGYEFTSVGTTKPDTLSRDLTLQNVWGKNCQVFLVSHMDDTLNEYIRFATSQLWTKLSKGVYQVYQRI